jgi:hypothetical protein
LARIAWTVLAQGAAMRPASSRESSRQRRNRV